MSTSASSNPTPADRLAALGVDREQAEGFTRDLPRTADVSQLRAHLRSHADTDYALSREFRSRGRTLRELSRQLR